MTTYNSNTSVAYKLQLEVTQQSQSVANNTTTLKWVLKMVKTNAAYQAYNTGGEKFKVVINGSTVLNANKTWDLRTATSVKIASGTKTVSHNANGTKSVAVSFSYTPSISSDYYPGSLSGSGTFNCTTIPRASTVSVSKSSADVGTSVTINITRASSSFTHNLYYKVGSGSNVSIGSGITTSKSWSIPASLLPNSSSSSVTITCDTYSGSTKIGSKTCSMTVTVPADALPTITAVTISESSDTSDIEAKFGAYVQNQSCLGISIDASGINGSTISSYSTVIDGTAYSGSNFTTNPIASSGEVVVRVTVKDSRGRTATYTETVSVAEYTAPTLRSVSAYRCDVNGDADNEGTYLKVEYSYYISSVGNLNDKQILIQYQSDGSTAWNTLLTDSSTYVQTNGTVKSSSSVLDADTAYTVRVALSDYFYSSDKAVINTQRVSTVFTLINFGNDGTTIGIGTMIEQNTSMLMKVALAAFFTGGLYSNGDMVAVNPSIAPADISPAASSHSTGELLVYDGKLYQATSPIASGESLAPGSNISPVSIADIIGAGPLTTTAQTIVQAINELNKAENLSSQLIWNDTYADSAKQREQKCVRIGHTVTIAATFYVKKALVDNTAILSGFPRPYGGTIQFTAHNLTKGIPMSMALHSSGYITRWYGGSNAAGDVIRASFTYITSE